MKSASKEKCLLYATYIAGVLGVAVFIITKNEFLMYKATASMFDDDDLYRFAIVRDFKTDFPAAVEEEIEDLDPGEQTLFLVGDSFSDDSRGHRPFSSLLASALGAKVYALETGNSPELFNLLCFFKVNNISKGPRRTIILERVERYIVSDFAEPIDPDPLLPKLQPAESFALQYKAFEERWFTKAEQNYQVFLTSSNMTAQVVEWFKTGVFHLLGEISSMTPVYSLNPPFLFYYEETNREETSFYYPHSDNLIAAIADNMEMMNDELQSRYNTELVFMPVPNKYTIYHTLVNNDEYDNFLPRLCTEVEKRGVKTIRLYERYKESKELLYFPTDSHWNERGVQIALDEAMKVLRATHKKVVSR